MADNNSKPLVIPGASAIANSGQGERVLSRMVSETLDFARRQNALRAPRMFHLGEYELQEPDYRQICKWATALGEEPAVMLSRLCRLVVKSYSADYEGQVIRIQDGIIRTVFLSSAYIPSTPWQWEPGLDIKILVIADRHLEKEEGTTEWKLVDTQPPHAWEHHGQLRSLERLSLWTSDVKIPNVFVAGQLKELGCNALQLGNLDLSLVPNLTRLVCYGNGKEKLSSHYEFDLSALKQLTELHIWDAPLRKLDLTHMTKLVGLTCVGTRLNELDLSPVPALEVLYCHSNNLQKLDLSPVPNLITLDCAINPLSDFRFSCDDTKPIALKSLVCFDCGLTELDLRLAPELEEIECGGNEMRQIDLAPVGKLVRLECGGNELSELDLSSVPKLEYLDCRSNQLSKLDLSAVPKISTLLCYGNKLSEIDLSMLINKDIRIRCGKSVRLIR